MRLQLDTTAAGASGGVGQAVPAAASDTNANPVGGVLSSAGDSIQISGASSALNRLATDRAAQIQQLASAVQGGSYQVASAAVGNALVEHALA